MNANNIFSESLPIFWNFTNQISIVCSALSISFQISSRVWEVVKTLTVFPCQSSKILHNTSISMWSGLSWHYPQILVQIFVSVFFFVAVGKTTWPKSLEEEIGLFYFLEYALWWREVRAGAQGRDLEEGIKAEAEMNTIYKHAFYILLSLLYFTVMTTCQGLV